MTSLEKFVTRKPDFVTYVQSLTKEEDCLVDILNILELSDALDVKNREILKKQLSTSSITKSLISYLLEENENLFLNSFPPIFHCSISSDGYTDRNVLILYLINVDELYFAYHKTSWNSEFLITNELPLEFCIAGCNDLIRTLEIELEGKKELKEEMSINISCDLDFNSDFLPELKERALILEKELDLYLED